MPIKNFHVLSFKYAFEGLVQALKQEPNLKFHIIAAILAIALSFFLNISKQDWINVILLIGIVFSVELTNTAVETVVDAFTEAEHPGAKLAKDISAGAVLIAAITAAIAGIFIFWPYLTS
ncbi:diacylglycerol kinase family protein [Candidatus Daviesbacteria bacterium]|nr:diacylglycerol kinase family protein [Candidatus Daviesbacteria bacterium]